MLEEIRNGNKKSKNYSQALEEARGNEAKNKKCYEGAMRELVKAHSHKDEI